MKFHVVTLFPEMIESASRIGVVGQALAEGRLDLATVNPRQFTSDTHHTVDDRPFGGGDGMIMLAEPLRMSLAKIEQSIGGENPRAKMHVVHLSPRGVRLTDQKVRELARQTNLVLIASRYGGVDERFVTEHVDEEISIGDYVLSGGELAVLVLIDAIGRLQPGVLGNQRSSEAESFAGHVPLLEHPQYTRPREWANQPVPEILLSGDHAKIAIFQKAVSLLLTLERRPDLLAGGESAPEMPAAVLQAAGELLDECRESRDLAKNLGLQLPEELATGFAAFRARFPADRSRRRQK